MALGKPSIPVLRSVDLREVQGAVNAIRERLKALDFSLSDLILQTGSIRTGNSQAIATLQAQIASLIALVGGPAIAELQDLLQQEDGFVVLVDGDLLTRVFVEGAGIQITNPDGVDGAPVFETLPTDMVLYDNEGRAMLTGDGRAILVGT